MTRCILYARFSPRPDAAESESNATQLELCRAHAARAGWRVAGEHQDDALSGDDLDRPGLWAAVEELKKGDILLVSKLDRLARSVYLAVDLERQAEAAGARIVSVAGEGTATNNPDDQLIRGIVQLLAQYQKRAQAARTRAAMQRHQAGGRRMSRADRCPLGWRPDPNDPKRMQKDPAEAAAIDRARALHSGGLSLRAICRQLAAEGLCLRGGHHQAIARVLARSE